MDTTKETNEIENTIPKSPETIIEDLGGCGKYQMRMSVVAHLMKMSICWCYMSYVIISKTPDFWCASDVNANLTYVTTLNNTEYDDHKACRSKDDTKCTTFRFDDSLRTVMSDFNLVCDYAFTASTIMSIQNVGIMIGNLFTGHIADFIGRKIPLFISVLAVIAAELLSLAAKGWELIAVVRFIIGLGQGAFFTVVYSLLGEFTLARHRSWVVGFPSWPLETAALCMLSWLVPDWRYINLGSAMIGIPFIFAWCVIPESFRWHLAHGKLDKAEKILEVIADYNNKPPVDHKRLEAILNDDTGKDRRYSLIDLFKTKQLIRVTILLSILWFGQSFIGIGLVFGIRQLSGNVHLNLLLMSLVGIPSKFIAIWTQNRFGRKASSIVGFGLTILACFGIGLVQNIVSETGLRGSLTNGLAIAANLLIAALWGPVQTMTLELYPTVVRNIGLGTVAVVGSIATIIVPQFDYLGESRGIPGLMYIACGVVGVLSFLSLFGLSETKDAYLDDTIPGSKREKIVV